MSRLRRGDVIDYLIAVCVKNNITPTRTGFADFILRACAGKFGMDKAKGKSFIDALISAWKFDRWKNHIKDNPYLTPEEKEGWFKRHG